MRNSEIAKKVPYVIGTIMLLLVAYFVYFLHGYLANSKGKKVVAQQITLITPPPPPPPPPPEPVKQPEVPEEKMPEETPETPNEQAQEEAPGQDLGIDSDGGAGTDGFGLIGRKGGTGLGIGKAGHYEVMVKEKLLDLVYADESLKHLAYSSVITVWVNSSGRVERFAISVEDGSPKIKKLLEAIVAKLTFESGPPIETADKGIKMRINSRI